MCSITDANILFYRVELLSFAVTFCSSEMIEPVLQARTLLETQVNYTSHNVETDLLY